MGKHQIHKNQCIEAWDRHVDDMRILLTEELYPLSSEALIWRPEPNRWSVVECVLHLEMAHKIYLQNLNYEMQQAQVHGIDEEIRFTFVGKQLTSALKPDNRGRRRWKIPTWRGLNPSVQMSGVKNPELVLELFKNQLGEFTGLFEQYRMKRWSDIRIPTLITPLLKLSVADAVAVISAHNERHVLQALEVVNQIK